MLLVTSEGPLLSLGAVQLVGVDVRRRRAAPPMLGGRLPLQRRRPRRRPRRPRRRRRAGGGLLEGRVVGRGGSQGGVARVLSGVVPEAVIVVI